jgi:WhiB family redox-sensing transcriptional regulator
MDHTAPLEHKWADRAACRGLEPTIFYPATDEEADDAKRVCDTCSVQTECLEFAIERREKDGVWGGATERERMRIIRRRRRQRQQQVAVKAS